MEQKFTKHLIDIGFIDKKTESQILSIYRQNYYKYNTHQLKFNELMTEILLSIINNLSEIQKKYICFHLPVKFIKLSNKFLKDKLRNIINKKILKTRLILLKYLFKWYRADNKYKKNISSNKNFFRQKPNRPYINTNNEYINKNYINENIRDFLFNNNNNDNEILKKYNSNLNTLNNENKSKTLQNTFKKKNINSNKTPKKIKYIYDKNIINLNSNDNNYINNMPTSTTINKKENKNFYTVNDNYINRIQKSNIHKKISNNDTLTSGLRDSLESNENCLSTNLNTINNRYNNNQDNKTLSQSDYIPNFDLMNYNIKTYKKISNNSTSVSTSKINNNFFTQYNNNNKNKSKTKNKSILMQNILKENFDNNNSFSSQKTRIKKNNKNDKNIYNLIYCNNYNNLNHNKYINDNFNYNVFTYQTPFCEAVKNSKSNKEYSACKRLFEDGKIRKKKHDQKKREQEKILDEMASGVSGEKKSVDYQRINYLYKNKEKSNTLEKTKNKVEKEEGLTFKPLISKNEYSRRIYGNFMERNLSGKSNDKCSNEYNIIVNNSNNINYRKKLSKKQKQKIVDGVINRLYSNSLMKSMSIYCDKHIKGLNTNLKPYKKKL